MASRAPAMASPAPAEAVAAPTPSRHFESPRVRTALRVSSPGDAAEREAEATARRVVAMPVPIRPRPIGPMERQAARAPAIPVPRPTMPGPTPSPEEKEMGPEMAAAIKGRLGGGRSLPKEAARFMEPRFGADFGKVRVHDDSRAASLANRLGARAFTLGRDIFFNRGEFQPEARSGKELLAHELTHTIQQGAAPQRGVVQREADPAAPVTVKETSGPIVQRGIKDRALAWIGDKANMIPGFRLFTIIIGVNPITGAGVEPSGANILRALVEFLPGGGLVTQALDRYSVFEKAGSWVEQQFRTLGMVGGMFIDAIKNFIGSLELGDVTDPGGVIDRGIRIFTDPVKRLIDFGKSLGAGILKFIREAILKPLAALAEGTAGYDLLKAVLGEDPVTGEAVTPTPDLVIGGFMKLIGQQEIWENIKKANAIARAWQWFKGAIAGLKALVSSIPKRFMDTLKSLEIMDLVLPPLAFAKVGKAFASFMGDFMSWGLGTVLQLLQIIFEVVAPAAVPYVKKAAGAFNTIIKNPIGFVGTLVAAGKLGFSQFRGNFLKHLQASLVGWLTGTMAGAGVYIPQGFNVREILKFALSVLGLTWANIRAKLVKATNETIVRALETGFDIVKTLVTQGPAAAWQQILEGLTNLKEMVIESIKDYVKSKVVEIAVTKLLSMLSPAGAFIQAIIAIYNTIMFFIERIRQIAAVAASFIDSIAAIAAGTIAPAAKRVESTMAGMLTLVISFLARFAGLGKVSDAVLKLIAKVRAPIDKGLDKVVAWIVAQARKLGKFIAQAGVPHDPKERLRLASRAAVAAAKTLRGTITAGALNAAFGAIKVRYGLTSISAFQKSGAWYVRARINPDIETPLGVGDDPAAEKIRKLLGTKMFEVLKPGPSRQLYMAAIEGYSLNPGNATDYPSIRRVPRPGGKPPLPEVHITDEGYLKDGPKPHQTRSSEAEKLKMYRDVMKALSLGTLMPEVTEANVTAATNSAVRGAMRTAILDSPKYQTLTAFNAMISTGALTGPGMQGELFEAWIVKHFGSAQGISDSKIKYKTSSGVGLMDRSAGSHIVEIKSRVRPAGVGDTVKDDDIPASKFKVAGKDEEQFVRYNEILSGDFQAITKSGGSFVVPAAFTGARYFFNYLGCAKLFAASMPSTLKAKTVFHVGGSPVKV